MEFNRYLLDEVCTLITDGAHTSPKAVEIGYDMLSVKDMKDFDFDYSNSKQISEMDYIKLVKNNCQPIKDDVLIAKDGNSCLESCFVFRENKPVVLLSSIAILRPNKAIINPYYLMYLLRLDTNKKALKDGYLSGSAIPRVVLKDFKKFPLYLPSLEDQTKIVNIIYNINNKIENNHQIIDTSERISQTLFKHWFIDFEFPNEEGKPYKSSEGEMVESELGEIPVNWKAATISDISKITMGQSPKSDTYNTDKIGLPLLNGAADFKNCNLSPNKYTSDPKKTGNKGDYVFGVRATIGLVTELDNTYAIGRGAGIATPLNSSLKEFVYETLKKAFNEFKYTASGSVYLNISKNDLNDFKLVKPTDKLIEKYHSHMKGILTQKQNLIQENITLKNLRDTLLPKLLSGEIEIPDNLEV